MLNKQNYFKINSQNFRTLSIKEQNKKYQEYVDRYKKQISNPINNANLKARPSKAIVIAGPNRSRVPKNNNNNNSNRKNDPGYTFRLSKCLISYAKASIDPFQNIQDMPCIPDNLVVPSFKYRTFADVDLEINAQGIGFAVYCPWKMAWNGNTSSAIPNFVDYPVVTTDSTYIPATYTINGALIAGGFLNGYNSNSPFNRGDYLSFFGNDQGSMRLVAAGLELQYTGVMLNQAGVVSTLSYDGLKNLPTGNNMAYFRSHQRAQTCPTSREARCYVRYEPTDSIHFSYLDGDYWLSDTTVGGTYPVEAYYPMGIFISGAQPNTTFRCRAVAYFESQQHNQSTSPSDSDAVGFSAFQSARSSQLPTPDPESDFLSIMKKTASNVINSLSGFVPIIGTAIGTAFGQPALGSVAGEASKNLLQSLFG